MTDANPPAPTLPRRGWPPVLRGWLLVVFVWILLQVLVALFRLFYVLQDAVYDERYYSYARTFGLTMKNWPPAAVELSQLVLVAAMHAWLLSKFLRQDRNFPSAFLAVMVFSFFALACAAVVLNNMLINFEGPRAGTGLVFALGIYQWLLRSPRAAAVFVRN